VFEVILCVSVGQGPRPYWDLGGLGYGSRVAPILGGALTGRELASIVEVADNPVRLEERERESAQSGPFWLSWLTLGGKSALPIE